LFLKTFVLKNVQSNIELFIRHESNINLFIQFIFLSSQIAICNDFINNYNNLIKLKTNCSKYKIKYKIYKENNSFSDATSLNFIFARMNAFIILMLNWII